MRVLGIPVNFKDEKSYVIKPEVGKNTIRAEKQSSSPSMQIEARMSIQLAEQIVTTELYDS